MSRARLPCAAAAVLIPTLNEATALPRLLGDLAAQRGIRLEVLVADGGSSDLTTAIARRHGARVVASPRGRGAQLNRAAAAAAAPWLICLHADSRLTQQHQLAQALTALRKARRQHALVAGHWPLRFLREQPGHDALFRHLEAKSASNRPGTVNGDQGLVLHRDTLHALGGFDEGLPFFEDQRLAAKVFAQGRFLLLPGLIETAARRFETEGHAPRMLLMALIVGAEAAGLDDWLASLPGLYREQRQAQRLQIAPFVDSLLAYVAALPRTDQRAVWRQAAALVSRNAWQLAQWLDAQQQRPQWLTRFDQHLTPLARSALTRTALALALPGLLRLVSRLERRRD